MEFPAINPYLPANHQDAGVINDPEEFAEMVAYNQKKSYKTVYMMPRQPGRKTFFKKVQVILKRKLAEVTN